jgi:aryl-alcohol dehydrogenase-like predicted oxidoreductase
MVHYRPLGNTGWNISEISLGTYPLGGALHTSGNYWSGPATYGAVALEEAVATIHAGLGQKLNFIDTAPVYGEAERFIAQALQHWPERLESHRVYVATKCGEHVYSVSGGGLPELKRDFSRAALQASLDRSRQRLGVDCLDLVFLHSPKPDDLAEDPLGLLVELRDRGQVTHIGVSAWSIQHTVELIRNDHRVKVLEVSFNLLQPQAARQLFPLAAERGLGLVIRSPLASGFLTGEITEEHVFKPDDYRSQMPREQLVRQVQQARAFSWLVEEGFAANLSEAALRYILSFPQVSTIIPGAMNVSELTRNLAVSDLGPLPETVLIRIQETQQTLGL